MKLDKLVKQTRRDLAANPKKAAALALMVLVAGYFWAPLAWKWFKPDGKKAGKPEQTQLILTDDPAQPKATGKTADAVAFRWEKVRQMIAADPYMASAAFDAAWLDPFAPPPPPAAAPEPAPPAADENPVAAVAEASPEEAGLKVTSILVSPRGRSTIINGESYREGETVLAETAGKAALPQTLEFVVARIERNAVELSRHGRTWRLSLGQPKLARGDGIQSSGSKPD